MTLQVREGFAAGGHGRRAAWDSSWPCPAGSRRQGGPASWGFLPAPACQSLSLPFRFSVATRVEQRKKMNCKSFRWYLDNVYPELT